MPRYLTPEEENKLIERFNRAAEVLSKLSYHASSQAGRVALIEEATDETERRKRAREYHALVREALEYLVTQV